MGIRKQSACVNRRPVLQSQLPTAAQKRHYDVRVHAMHLHRVLLLLRALAARQDTEFDLVLVHPYLRRIAPVPTRQVQPALFVLVRAPFRGLTR